MSFPKIQGPLSVPMATGRVYASQFLYDTGAGAAITANRLYAVPFIVSYPTIFQKMGTRVTTGVDNENLRFGIYTDSAGVPTNLVAQTGNVLASSAGTPKAVSGAFTVGNLQLMPGVYWIAMVGSNGGINVAFYSVTDNNEAALGRADFVDVDAATHVFVAHNFGALPDPFGSPTYAGAAVPVINIQVA